MSTLADLQAALNAAAAGTIIKIDFDKGPTLTLQASDLEAGLVVGHPSVAYTGYVNTDVLHLRKAATIHSDNLRDMPLDTPLDVLNTLPIVEYAPDHSILHTWRAVTTHDGAHGYVAEEFVSKGVPPPIIVPPTPPVKPPKLRIAHKIGLHCLEDSAAVVMNYVSRLNAAGIMLAGATVVNNAALATWLADGRAAKVIYRPGVGKFPDLVSPPAGMPAREFGRQIVDQRFAGWDFSALKGENIHLQFQNEMKLAPWHSEFYLGVMDACHRHGFRAAIGAYQVGTPEPEEYALLEPALVAAMAAGDVMCLHTGTKYTPPAAAPGELSLPGDRPFWELRHRRLIAAVPENARPGVFLGEFASGQNGAFPGVVPEVELLEKYDAEIAQDETVICADPFTDGQWGGWSGSDIDPALPMLYAWMVK